MVLAELVAHGRENVVGSVHQLQLLRIALYDPMRKVDLLKRIAHGQKLELIGKIIRTLWVFHVRTGIRVSHWGQFRVWKEVEKMYRNKIATLTQTSVIRSRL